jgi:hypothetical protein
MCELSMVFNFMKMNCNYVCSFQTLCSRLQILVIIDNHEFYVSLKVTNVCVFRINAKL